MAINDNLSLRGLRVLAVASGDSRGHLRLNLHDLTFVGLRVGDFAPPGA